MHSKTKQHLIFTEPLGSKTPRHQFHGAISDILPFIPSAGGPFHTVGCAAGGEVPVELSLGAVPALCSAAEAPVPVQGAMSARRALKAVLVDLNGTLHIEDSAVPGAQEALRRQVSLFFSSPLGGGACTKGVGEWSKLCEK